MSRRKISGLLLGAVVLSSVFGWVAASQIRSPAEIAARTAPPAASPIFVPAEQRVVSTDVVTRGTGRFGSPQRLALAPTALKTLPAIVGRVPLAGTELSEGDVVLTASGRPVFLLTGVQPTFRDLGPGLEGEDVRQLETALSRLGFDPGPVDGVYDGLTETAVAAWYESAGFAPMETSAQQLATIRALEAELSSRRLEILGADDGIAAAEAELRAAQAALNGARAVAVGQTTAIANAQREADVANRVARAEVQKRQAALDALVASGAGTTAATPLELTAAQNDLTLAVKNQEVIRLTGVKDVAAAVAGGVAAEITNATALAAAANAAAAADVAAKQAVLNAVLAGTPKLPPTIGEIQAALADVEAAEANEQSVRLAGERAVAAAEAATPGNQAGVTAAATRIRDAEAALERARTARAVRLGPAGGVSADLGLALRRAGIQVPADELIFVPSTPVRVAEVAVLRGDAAVGAIMTVTDAIVAVDGSLPLEAGTLVRAGMPVVIDEPDLGIEAKGIVNRVAETPGTNGVDGFHIYFEVLVDESPPGLVGASVRLTVPVEGTEGPVLAVPISALALAPDGSSRVQRQGPGALEFVTVRPGLAADGFVEVTPVQGQLEPGDLVVVGFESQAATQ